MTERKRVQHRTNGWTGTLLRLERYPGSGTRKLATVLWDWAFSARRAEPNDLQEIR